PFRRALRELGGMGLATTDLVQATMLLSRRAKSLELIATSSDDKPLTVQIFSGIRAELVGAAKWLEDAGYQGIDINMGCPMAKVTGSGGGARLMCDTSSACDTVSAVVGAVGIPVSVKMRLGWDLNNLTAPALAREFEQLGVVAVTIHGRTRQQGFHGSVNLDGIAEVVAAVDQMPIIGNGDVRSPQDALHMQSYTGCAAIAIGRGAMLDPWIFRKLHDISQGRSPRAPENAEKLAFLKRHFELMVERHEDYACLLFRKFAAWYGATLGIPEPLEDRLRRIESMTMFDELADEIGEQMGQRQSDTATALIKTPSGPVEHW
ncbi:MAG: tRNA-dihydrouridine synthase, partial [Planctomycetaceae bacterium]|nr:tRNA-dihydrouridine synthase [Planctomycetaceae bacterium]